LIRFDDFHDIFKFCIVSVELEDERKWDVWDGPAFAKASAVALRAMADKLADESRDRADCDGSCACGQPAAFVALRRAKPSPMSSVRSPQSIEGARKMRFFWGKLQ